jgi:predicted RNase H-like HicB family nuclease
MDVSLGVRMTESIALDVNLQAFVRRDTPRRWVATCPMVGVASQGKTAEEARGFLQEAVELWFESCVERGVLDQALREANFRPFRFDRGVDQEGHKVKQGRPGRREKNDVLGDRFDIHLSIPAYEASTLLSATA